MHHRHFIAVLFLIIFSYVIIKFHFIPVKCTILYSLVIPDTPNGYARDCAGNWKRPTIPIVVRQNDGTVIEVSRHAPPSIVYST